MDRSLQIKHAHLLTILFAALFSFSEVVKASASNNVRPLGLLITPISSNVPAPTKPIPVSSSVGTDQKKRPLGILFNAPIVQTPQETNQFTTGKPLGNVFKAFDHSPQMATPKASAGRPLGILIKIPQGYPLTRRLPSDLTPIIQPMKFKPITKPSPRSDSSPATADRPLGTLLYPIQVPQSRTISPALTTFQQSTLSTELPVNLSADEMTFDREKGIVIATGNVEIRHKGRELFSNSILYNQDLDLVTAEGNVTIVEPTGEKIFGTRMELTGDLKDAVIENVGLILTDHARIAGAEARRSAGRITNLEKATYSPCNLCKDEPKRPPLWQIKAIRVTHDKERKIVEYRDAWLEMFGFPMFYTPYFRHPDPTIKRQSGFLFPRYGTSTDFGIILETPYYWNISPNEDMTINPVWMTNEFPLLSLEYRNRVATGELNIDASGTKNSKDEFNTTDGALGLRGHVDLDGRFDINRMWRWGLDLERTTDDTYLRRYRFNSPRSFNSQIFAEAFRSRSYFSASSHVFQGLEASDSSDNTPIIIPLMDFNHVGNRDPIGGRSFLDVNFLALTRAEGTDTRRISFHPRWARPLIIDTGDLLKLTFGLNTDFYHVNGLIRNGIDGSFNGFSYRAVPYTTIDWSRPVVRHSERVSQTFEPIASVTIRPYGGNPDKIPNEDSTDLEFDENNLFSDNRFTGIDRLEGGPRINYGAKWSVTGNSGGRSSVFLGQSFRLKDDDTFVEGMGLEEKLSDLVGKVQISPSSHLDLLYRTRLSTNLNPRRNEAKFALGVPAINISGSYIFLDRQQDSEFPGREEMNVSAAAQLTPTWKSTLQGVRDLDTSEMRSIGMNFIYENECVVFQTRIGRAFFKDRDLKPTDTVNFMLTLKTLGEVKSSFSQ